MIATYNSADQPASAHCTPCSKVELVEVVVADNAWSDASAEVAKQARDVPVRIVRLSRNSGYAAGINAAI